MKTAFNLREYDITVAEVHRNLPAQPALRTRHPLREGCEHRGERRPGRLFRRQDGPFAEGQARRQAPRLGSGRLVGAGEHPARRAIVRNQPRARARLPQHPRTPVLLRRLRRLGPEVSHQGARHLLAAVPRAVHAHDADPARRRRNWRRSASPTSSSATPARFPANRLTAGVDSKTSICLSLEDRELIILGTEYAGEMKKGVFTVANYFAPKRGLLSMHCSATADRQIGPLVAALRAVGHGQDNALRRPEA